MLKQLQKSLKADAEAFAVLQKHIEIENSKNRLQEDAEYKNDDLNDVVK